LSGLGENLGERTDFCLDDTWVADFILPPPHPDEPRPALNRKKFDNLRNRRKTPFDPKSDNRISGEFGFGRSSRLLPRLTLFSPTGRIDSH
jgi:hypothetical protein